MKSPARIKNKTKQNVSFLNRDYFLTVLLAVGPKDSCKGPQLKREQKVLSGMAIFLRQYSSGVCGTLVFEKRKKF